MFLKIYHSLICVIIIWESYWQFLLIVVFREFLMKQIFKLVGGRGVVSYVGYLKHHTVFFFERILRSLSLANCLPISLNLIAFVSTLQKATQMKFFMDKIIVNGYLLNWIFSYQVHNILTQGWSTLHGSWQTDWRGRPDAYDFITLYGTML